MSKTKIDGLAMITTALTLLVMGMGFLVMALVVLGKHPEV